MNGDCGSWVVDAGSGDVYGMIVASSDQTNTSYCVSMNRIMDRISMDAGQDAGQDAPRPKLDFQKPSQDGPIDTSALRPTEGGRDDPETYMSASGLPRKELDAGTRDGGKR